MKEMVLMNFWKEYKYDIIGIIGVSIVGTLIAGELDKRFGT